MKLRSKLGLKVAVTAALISILMISTMWNAAFAQMPSINCLSDEAQNIVKKKKKRIKAYVTDFWRLGESIVPKLPVDMHVKGFVAGDLHFGNVDVYMDLGTRPNKPRFTFNDIDEVGTNNYIVVDLMKYLAYLGTLKPALNLDPVVDAYVLGLEGKSVKIPSELADLLKMNASDFAKKKAKYLAKQHLEGQKLALAEISKKDLNTKEMIAKLPIISQMSEVQSWTAVNDNGSSAGMMRFLFAGKNASVPGVIEFKEVGCTAAGDVEQQNLEVDFDSFVNYTARFMGIPAQYTYLDQQAVAFVDGRYFLVREKVPGIYKELDVETSSPEIKQAHAEYLASYLGGFHSAKAPIGYRTAIANGKTLVLQTTTALAAEFEKQSAEKQKNEKKD